MEKIQVTQAFLPKEEEYAGYVRRIFASNILTNQGPNVVELEEKLQAFCQVPYLHYVTNGTIALQLALRALDVIGGEIITTPFSYVATTSSILWESCTPVFVDIEPNRFTIDPERIEKAITKRTKGILAVHVFGFPCFVEEIQRIADKYSLKVIYDAAHSFGVTYKGRPLVCWGDVATLSFHATKLFHTIEGGACVTPHQDVYNRIDILRRFGHLGDTHYCLGINGKQSEFHAAMGLANLPYVEGIIAQRKMLSECYDSFLAGCVALPKMRDKQGHNYAYYPILLKNEQALLEVVTALNSEEVYPRRYFYPSLNTLPYLARKIACPVSEDICSRVLCLPLYVGLETAQVEKICITIRRTVQ